MRTIQIDVTDEDIAKGARYQCGSCPIALAARRASGIQRVEVTGLDITFYHEGAAGSSCGFLPDTAAQFVWRFDTCDLVAPFSFTVTIP